MGFELGFVGISFDHRHASSGLKIWTARFNIVFSWSSVFQKDVIWIQFRFKQEQKVQLENLFGLWPIAA